ncbi:NAD(P)H-dependent oxidoreductase [Brevundimonas sp.]|uniref:NAD(P)H-dependent oxidoreductase n=1 Tax=Brevundimonas sp. TaxID=1871086 RepID=UPI002FCC4200
MTVSTVPTRIALVLVHPRKRSFTATMAGAFAQAAREAGAGVEVRDLYRLRFDPRLRASEMPDHPGFRPRADVLAEREAIGKADVFAFFYPLWFNGPPAMLKGYVERVFGLGFGYSPIRHGGNQPMLEGRRLVAFTSSGAPQDWVECSGAWTALRENFDNHLAAMTGLELIGHHNFGDVGAGLSRKRIEACAAEVGELARRIVSMCAAG